MNNIKILSLSVIGIVLFIISITLVKFLLKQSKIIPEKTFTLSYSTWTVCLLISFSIINAKALSVINEALDLIYKTQISNVVYETLQITALFIAISVVWFWVSYLLNSYIVILLLGNRINANEIDNDNYTYFLIKGITLISLNSLFLIVFTDFLRTFLPNINTPFYH